MTDHHATKTTVVALPERLTNRQIRLTVAVEAGMGRTPAVCAIEQRQLIKAMQPLSGRGCLRTLANVLKGMDQRLFVIAP